MDSPPDLEHNQQFLVMAEVFINHGIPVPTIINTDLPRGFVLMTDLGDLDFSNAVGHCTKISQQFQQNLLAIIVLDHLAMVSLSNCNRFST